MLLLPQISFAIDIRAGGQGIFLAYLFLVAQKK
jgi:hypothetical protein